MCRSLKLRDSSSRNSVIPDSQHFWPKCLQVRGRMPELSILFGSNKRRLFARAKRVNLVLDLLD